MPYISYYVDKFHLKYLYFLNTIIFTMNLNKTLYYFSDFNEIIADIYV